VAAEEDEPRAQDRIPALHAGAAAAVEGADDANGFYGQRSWADVLREAGVNPAAAADPEVAQLLLQSGQEWEAASSRSSSTRSSHEKASARERSSSSLDKTVGAAAAAGGTSSGRSSMERQLSAAKLQSAAARAAFEQWQLTGLAGSEGQPQEAAPTTHTAIPVPAASAAPSDDSLQLQQLAALPGASRQHHGQSSLLSTITECSELPSRVASVASFAASARGSVEVPGAVACGSVERLSLSAARNSCPGYMRIRISLSSLGNGSSAAAAADRAVNAEQLAALVGIRRLKATLLQAGDGYV
jgi:hypothetical protein